MLYWLLYIVPKKLMSHWVGLLVHRHWPLRLNNYLKAFFIKKYGLNMDEAELPTQDYPSLGALFVRRLKPGIRPISPGIIHPADSTISEINSLDQNILIQAKDKTYTLDDLVGEPSLVARLLNGVYLTYYLCPADYHRVHCPVSGWIDRSIYIPGHLWPVNPWSVQNIRNLFAINERLIIPIESERGLCVVVMVGATNVGQMSLTFDPNLKTNLSSRISSESPHGFLKHFPFAQRIRKPQIRNYKSPPQVSAGQELGIFHLGSTVITLYEKGFLGDPIFAVPGPVRMGDLLSE